MGTSRTFTIKNKDKEKVRNMILRLSKRMQLMMGKQDHRRAWLDHAVMNKKSLNEIFGLWECQVSENEKGDIVEITPSEARVGDLDLLFTTIGAFVEEGSSVAVLIPDKEKLKVWEFNGKFTSSRWEVPPFIRTRHASDGPAKVVAL
jgi:hypothetical protein